MSNNGNMVKKVKHLLTKSSFESEENNKNKNKMKNNNYGKNSNLPIKN